MPAFPDIAPSGCRAKNGEGSQTKAGQPDHGGRLALQESKGRPTMLEAKDLNMQLKAMPSG